MKYKEIDITAKVENPDPDYPETYRLTQLNYLVWDNIRKKASYAYILSHPNDEYTLTISPKAVRGIHYLNPNNYFVQRKWGATSGSTIVCSQKDICLCVGSCDEDPKPDWITKLYYGLNAKGIPAITEGNDILVNGYKIAGLGKNVHENGFICYNIVINIDDKLDVIKECCLKQMVKVPKGLENWGITRQDVIDMLGIEIEQ